MSFDKEWASLKSDAQSKSSPHMQLNGYNAENRQSPKGGYVPDLAVKRDDLGAVGKDAYELHRKLQKCADIDGKGLDGSGRSTTDRAARELEDHEFQIGAALKTAVKIWNTQRKTLQQGCARISNHLDYTKDLHSKEDADIAASLTSRDGKPVSTSAIYKWIK
ncbi:hypothetical protein [Streptomyces spirodelae]|uniref:AG1 protein n=1 Tax=Streptomyces spirodelae TaxID=2812904 RepID=A0ABS3WRI7_9ACTN|nr:hypothetical protein [Streptomyces spirodelae]MBO8185481.1 hypothetical protein [Streptomyces spirodelae]